MIVDKNVNIRINGTTLKYWRDLGYVCNNNEIINVDVKHLSKSSNIKIKVSCDSCNQIIEKSFNSYNRIFEKNNAYYCTKCVKSKITKNTVLEKYGVDNPSKFDIFKEKIKKTNIEKYGVTCTLHNDIVKEKSNNTLIEKYGTIHISQNEEMKNKLKQTNLKKYGVEYPIQNKDIAKKIIDKKNEKYIKNIVKELKNTDYSLIEYSTYNLFLSHNSKNHNFNISVRNFYNRLKIYKTSICTTCYPISEQLSIKEKELNNWLKNLNIDIICSDRNILNGKELDIYIPLYNLAIEFNGLYWHSEINIDKNYHLNKSLICKEKGIHLIHIFEDEWVFKQDIIKSIILNKINKIENKIYARNCEVREVKDSRLVREFLDTNHIQGYSQSSIKLGLYYNNKLVSLMTFGYRHTNSKKEFELIRFCNILNTNVIGASSRLFKYFLNNYTYDSIISYSDFRMFDGKMYETLGFKFIHLSEPNYYWVKNLDRNHRFNFNKQKLIKEGYDPNKTEVEIMYERGYSRIWSCGQVRWEFFKK